MKRIFYVAIIIITSLFFTNCDTTETNGDGSSNSLLVGTWYLSKLTLHTNFGDALLPPSIMGMSMTVIIKDDYTYQVSITSPDGPQTDSGTWSESGNSLTINSTVDNMQQIVSFTITSETLVFEMTNFDFMEGGIPATLEFAKQQPSGTIPLSQLESALVGNYELISLTVSTSDSSVTLSGEDLDMSVTLTVSDNRVFTAVSNEQGQTITDIGTWSASSNLIFVLWNTGDIDFISYSLIGSTLTLTFYQNETIDDNFERLTFSKQ